VREKANFWQQSQPVEVEQTDIVAFGIASDRDGVCREDRPSASAVVVATSLDPLSDGRDEAVRL
jgi:hypothetical protein